MILTPVNRMQGEGSIPSGARSKKSNFEEGARMGNHSQGDRNHADANSAGNRQARETAAKRQDRHAAQQDSKRRI